jgi:CheY-like chemotaxis protein
MSKHTILVVDDDRASRRFARSILEKEGYQALEASSGLQALLMALNCRPPIDLLVAHPGLPGIDGAKLLEKFSQAFPATPAALLSKPFEPDSLVQTVRDLLVDSAPKKQPGNAGQCFRNAEVSDRSA